MYLCVPNSSLQPGLNSSLVSIQTHPSSSFSFLPSFTRRDHTINGVTMQMMYERLKESSLSLEWESTVAPPTHNRPPSGPDREVKGKGRRKLFAILRQEICFSHMNNTAGDSLKIVRVEAKLGVYYFLYICFYIYIYLYL